MAINRVNQKESLRTRLRQQRESRYVEHNLSHLLEIPEISEAKTIVSYCSYGYEPDTTELNLKIIASGRKLLLPRVCDEDLEWVEWDGSESSLKPHGKILEPIGPSLSNLENIDFIFVPALAIDPDGYRLGQGGGFYDRALPKLQAWKHGVVYSFERMEHDLPRDPWDIPMDSW